MVSPVCGNTSYIKLNAAACIYLFMDASEPIHVRIGNIKLPRGRNKSKKHERGSWFCRFAGTLPVLGIDVVHLAVIVPLCVGCARVCKEFSASVSTIYSRPND